MVFCARKEHGHEFEKYIYNHKRSGHGRDHAHISWYFVQERSMVIFMNRKISVGVAVSIVFIAIAMTFTATMIYSMGLFDSKVEGFMTRSSLYTKLTEIDTVVRQNFFYEINESFLYDEISAGYIEGIQDENTAYLTALDVEDFYAAAKGTVVSVGLECTPDATGYITVSRVIDNSPAQQAGLVVGDTLVEIGGTPVTDMEFEQANDLLYGTEGTRISVTYRRQAVETTVDLAQTSFDAEAASGFLRDDGIYYISINQFSDAAVSQFEYELLTAQSKAAVGLIIDIRDTAGGNSFNAVAEMANQLLPAGKTITAEFKNNEVRALYTSDEVLFALPLVILVNENTTGFAEIFAATLKDSANSCEIIGTTTAGHGKYGQVFEFSDGSGIYLTVARFLTSSGETIDENGVAPNFEVSAFEGFRRTSEPTEDSDSQFKRAVDILTSMVKT